MPQLTPITPQQFSNKAWRRIANNGFGFAAQNHMLPVVATELAKLIPAMPMGFVPAENGFQLVAITALQPRSNLFVALDGRWLGGYVPAAMRVYPFYLIKPQDREESVLCFDESSGLLADAGQSEAFFDTAGAPSQAVKDVLDFLVQTERSRVATQAAVDGLQRTGLIQPWPMTVKKDGKDVAIEGLYRINEAALNELPESELASLRTLGALRIAYAQLFSMNQIGVLDMLKSMQEKALLQPQAETGLGGFKLQDDGVFKF